MFTETHAHYDDPRYDADRTELLGEIRENGIKAVINVSSDIGSAEKAAALSESYGFIYAAAGVHPHYAKDITNGYFDALRAVAFGEKIVAIGECGLDFHYENTDADKAAQRLWFAEQLRLAGETRKPVVVHSRDASREVYETVKEYAGRLPGGVLHCFSGDAQTAGAYVKLGFYIGIGGIVTFKNAKTLAETVYALPLERVLLETDCPYLSPEPYRGSRNDSRNLRLVAERVAEIKGVPVQTVADVTNANAKRLFGLRF